MHPIPKQVVAAVDPLKLAFMEQEQEETPDEVLVVAAILGDLHAFDELVRRYRSAVLRLVRVIAGAGIAEDVAQEAWLLAFKALPSVDQPDKFASWLMVLVRNRALRARDREQKRSARQVALDVFLLEQLGALSAEPTHRLDEEEALQTALQAIPEDYRLALQLRFFDAMPLIRIAAFLDVPLSTVKWRVFNGKKLLREQFEKQESIGHE
jgi:RNA polymerase sigma-70 factor (ECF subfamily)